ncbi:MAG TPA: class I SAM-dependent methyltransferase [Candidatus Dojkabacteria bacterium]|nr:class I SAM-dependent methyltransferase [Candidatus Dojkabacteria bacterium]
MKINPNDATAQYYDFYTLPVKGSAVTGEEITLIKSLLPVKGNILDIGCGTGRHLITLVKLGFQVTGIDSAKNMIKVIKKKLGKKSEKIKLINQEFFSVKLPLKNYNLITLFWNTFNEIALSKDKALTLLVKIKQLLKPQGRILINIDNPQLLKLPKLKFTNQYQSGNKIYLQNWQVLKFNKVKRLTVSQEQIIVKSYGHVISNNKSEIMQRWWGKKELLQIFKRLKLKAEFVDLKANDEFYIILKKIT